MGDVAVVGVCVVFRHVSDSLVSKNLMRIHYQQELTSVFESVVIV